MATKFDAVMKRLREIRDQEYEEAKHMTPREYAEREDARSRQIEDLWVWEHALDERLHAEDEAAGAPGAFAACTPDERQARADRMRERMKKEMERMPPEERRERLDALSNRYTERMDRWPARLTPEQRRALFRDNMRFHAKVLTLGREREARRRPQPAPQTGAAQPLAGAAGEA